MNYEELVLNLLSDITGQEPEELKEIKDVNLFTSGVVDSLSISSLIAEAEEALDKKIELTKYSAEDFATINKIISVLEDL